MSISASMTRNFIATLLYLSVTVLIFPASSLAAQDIASFTELRGEVRIKSSVRAKGRWLRVKKTGVTLFSGDEIRTLAGSAEITFDDGSVMKVSENTSFKLEERPTKRKLFGFINTSFMNRNVKMSFGKLWANIKKVKGKWTSFESKVAVAGIKGTSVSMTVDSNGDMQFACHEGVAAIAKPDGSFELTLESGKEVWIKSKDQGKTLVQSVKGDLNIESKNGEIDLEDKGSVLIGESTEGTSVGVPGSDERIVKVSSDSLRADLDAGDEIVIGIDKLEGKTTVTSVRNISGSVDIWLGDIKAMLGAGDALTVTVNSADGTITLTIVSGNVDVTRDGETTEMSAGESWIDDVNILNIPKKGAVGDVDVDVDCWNCIKEPLPVEEVEEDCGSSAYMLGQC